MPMGNKATSTLPRTAASSSRARRDPAHEPTSEKIMPARATRHNTKLLRAKLPSATVVPRQALTLLTPRD